MDVTITIEVDDEFVDTNHSTGLTNDGYERLTDALTGSVASSIVDIKVAAR